MQIKISSVSVGVEMKPKSGDLLSIKESAVYAVFEVMRMVEISTRVQCTLHHISFRGDPTVGYMYVFFMGWNYLILREKCLLFDHLWKN